MLVQEFLEGTARRLPDKLALVCGERRLTYAEVDAQADRLAQGLRAAGLPRGGRVVILLANTVEAVVSIFAVLKAGGTFVVVNPTTKSEKLIYILNNCQASVFITHSEAPGELLDPVLVEQAPALRGVVVCGEGAAAATVCAGRAGWTSYEAIQREYPAERLPRVNIDLDLACLIYTSGSTGEPKGVMCDHSNVTFVSRSVVEYLENTERDIVLNVLPLSYGYGLYQPFMMFDVGATLVLENSFLYPAAILQQMARERVTGLPGIPTMYARLLQMDLSAYDLSHLRYLTNAAAALPTAHVLEVVKRFPQAKFYSMYGLTETKRTLYLPPEQLALRPDSVGVAIPGTECWVVDEEGNRLPAGEVGELVVRGRHVMRGYWGNPDASARRFRYFPETGERLCFTGDLFRTDGEGYFYFVSRQDDIIKSRGEKVAPKEVEEVLYRLPGVIKAAVVGVPDPVLGQAVKAFLVVEGRELTAAQVQAWCRAHLEDYMVPKQVAFVEEMPVTATGKIKKRDLTACAALSA